MNKHLLVIILSLSVNFSVHASTSVIQDLKNTPVTAYQIGKNQLTSIAMVMNYFAGKDGSERVNIIEDEKSLGVEYFNIIPAKNISSSTCEEKFQEVNKLGILKNAPQFLWPNLTGEQTEAIRNELFLKITLIAKENNNFTSSCVKKLSEIN